MLPGTKVIVTRGGHRGKKATVVGCPNIQLHLTVGGEACGPPIQMQASRSVNVWIEFDDESIKGGKWGSGAFEYRPDKLEEFNALDELAAL